jgi:hypothetical protein
MPTSPAPPGQPGDRGPVRVTVTRLDIPIDDRLADLVRRARRTADFQNFMQSRQQELRGVLEEESEAFVPRSLLQSAATTPHRIRGDMYLFITLDRGISVVPEEYAKPDDFFVIRRFLFRIHVTGIPYHRVIDNQAEFSGNLAERLAKAIQGRRRSSKVTIVIDEYSPGSLEFIAGVGVGAAALQLASIIKDYPNIKKGAKEISEDVKHAVKKVIEKFKKDDG